MEMKRSGTAPITINAEPIGQGEQAVISLPLAGKTVESRMMEPIDIRLRMDNAATPADARKYYWNLHLYLEPPPGEPTH